MRRTQDEITDFAEKVDVLRRCDVIRLGMYGGDYPYVIPLFFGFEVLDEQVILYFHSAKEGLKRDLLAFNNRVCVEGDLFHGYVGAGGSMTADYESVLGFGIMSPVEGEAALHGLALLMEHCGDKGYDPATCPSLSHTQVYQIRLELLYGKRRFPSKAKA